jgi:hypothetical protein
MRKPIVRTRIIIAAAVILATVIPLAAHHTAAYIYDVEKPVSMKGVVTEIEWKNPHVLVHFDVKSEEGAPVSWTVEARAVYIMKRQGIEQNFIKAGDAVAMIVCPARDGSHKGGLEYVELPNRATTFIGECVRQPR